MSNRIPLLFGLAVLQFVLIGLVTLGSSNDEPGQSFLDFAAESVTGLTIEDAAGSVVQLEAREAGWRLVAGDLPADADKIAAVLESLAGGAATWPVATSASSQSRFEVTEQTHQRRLRLSFADGGTVEVFLGTSPGFRRVHARAADADEIYSIDFALHEVPTEADEWLDKYLLRPDSISRVTFPDGRTLARDGEAAETAWLLDGGATDPDSARQFVERIERLTVLGLYEADAEAPTLGPARTISVEDSAGVYELSFELDADNDEYVLTTDRFGRRFTVASYLAEQILIDAAELLPAADQPGDPVEQTSAEETDPASP